MIIDTHCHLDDNRYNEDLDSVIKRAIGNGVGGFLLPGADIKDLQKAKEISSSYKEVYYSAGVHPYHADEYNREYLKKFLEDDRCIAVGECGLDYYRLPDGEEQKIEEKELQKRVFREHIDLAIEYQKPIIVHIRDASSDSKEILLERAKELNGGVLHCYNASEILLELAQYNFYFGIGGVITFKNAKKLIEVLPKIPLDRVLLETDAPYLTPHPFRGKRNEPSYTRYILEKLSEVLNIEIELLEEQILKNSKELFKEF